MKQRILAGLIVGSCFFGLSEAQATVYVVHANFDADLYEDKAEYNSSCGKLKIYYGTGAGYTLSESHTIDEGGGGSSGGGIAVADLDGDGNQDLVVASIHDQDVTVFAGNGDDTFNQDATYSIGSGPEGGGGSSGGGIVLAAFDGMNYSIAVLNTSDQTVGVLLGNGDGTFQGQNAYGLGFAPDEISVSDTNADTFLDITASQSGTRNSTILLGNGSGGFE